MADEAILCGSPSYQVLNDGKRLVGLALLMVVGRGGVHAVLATTAAHNDLKGACVLSGFLRWEILC